MFYTVLIIKDNLTRKKWNVSQICFFISHVHLGQRPKQVWKGEAHLKSSRQQRNTAMHNEV